MGYAEAQANPSRAESKQEIQRRIQEEEQMRLVLVVLHWLVTLGYGWLYYTEGRLFHLVIGFGWLIAAILLTTTLRRNR